ncbi:MATE family efflux transporter [Streptomyces sp. NBC_01317]|uniref:MATE family efflux transporter n=1 Tax=Streptomyces sp. NBC_01317 TaxID=2903822 RepID=UPI002E142EAD|nr:MATE family efflux transporter [Streptomyces sp. NBC_01317]
MPGMLLMGVTAGVLPLLAYAYGKGDRRRLSAALRGSFLTVGGVAPVFAVGLFVFREQVFSAFSADPSALAVGTKILAAQLLGMIATGFANLFTSLFQAAGRAVAATVTSAARGIAFVPIAILSNQWWGLDGLISALPASEGLVLLVGVALWLASRHA